MSVRRPKAIAIAAVQQNPFALAAQSVRNAVYALLDVMYGTQERTNMTVAFALALLALGMSLNGMNPASMSCSN